MAKTPRFKIYSPEGEYVASVKDETLGAVLVIFLGRDATIRDGHKKILWIEGADGNAFESYDKVAEVCISRRTGKEILIWP